MGFPLEDVLGGMGFLILVLIFVCSPAIIGTLIGQIGRLIRYIFKREDDDD